jgi:hypothetical protein
LVPAITGISGLILGVAAGGVGFKVIDDMTVKAAEARTEAAAEEALEDQKDTLRSAVRRCISSGNKSFAVLADRRTTLTLEQKGKDDYLGGISATELWCVIDRLDAPAAVVSHMEQTTSLDGRQTEVWDGFEASWSFHPDRGMDTVITIVGD